MSEYTYTKVARPEGSEEPEVFDQPIEKSGIKVTFTIRELEASRRSAEQFIKASKGQIVLQEAICKNVEEHHPYVLEATPEQLSVYHTYAEAMSLAKTLPQKIAEMEEALADMDEQYKEITAQTGIEIPKPTPVENTNG